MSVFTPGLVLVWMPCILVLVFHMFTGWMGSNVLAGVVLYMCSTHYILHSDPHLKMYECGGKSPKKGDLPVPSTPLLFSI